MDFNFKTEKQRNIFILPRVVSFRYFCNFGGPSAPSCLSPPRTSIMSSDESYPVPSCDSIDSLLNPSGLPDTQALDEEAAKELARAAEDAPAAWATLHPLGDWIETVYPQSGPLEQAWRIVSRDALAKLVSELEPGTQVNERTREWLESCRKRYHRPSDLPCGGCSAMTQRTPC